MLDKCCFCVDLRVGCIILGVLEILSSCSFFAVRDGEVMEEHDKYFGEAKKYAVFTANSVAIIACVSLIYGAIKYNWIATWVYLVFETSKIILTGVAVVWYSVDETKITSEGGSNGTILISIRAIGISLIIRFLLSIYYWLCAFSLYKKIKKGEDEQLSKV